MNRQRWPLPTSRVYKGTEDPAAGSGQLPLTSFIKVDHWQPGRFANDTFFATPTSAGSFGSVMLGR